MPAFCIYYKAITSSTHTHFHTLTELASLLTLLCEGLAADHGVVFSLSVFSLFFALLIPSHALHPAEVERPPPLSSS